ncbi:MAG: TonB-dependent receptor [Burkholderiales bacterium]|jgi:iron complex outermembrane receptor protein|nr:TonB-dependent receptor [Burkholderiales bacterium]
MSKQWKLSKSVCWYAVLAALGFLPYTAWTQEKPVVADSAPASSAQDEQDNKPSGVFELGTISVQGEAQSSAEKLEVAVDEEKIDMFEKKDVGKALARLPGVLYQRARGSRYESNVLVRGFASGSKVPIYIDGIPTYVPYDGFMDLGRFTTADVSEIRVAKGYSSVLYGPNTLGGVINIVTQRPTKALDGKAVVGVSTGQGSETAVKLGTLQNMWYAQVNASYYEQKYIKTAEKFRGSDETRTERDTDEQNYRIRDKKASVKLGFIPNETDEYVLSYLNQKGVKGYRPGRDGFVAQTWEWPNWDRETISFVSNTRWGDALYVKPRVYYDKFDNAMYGWGGNDSISWYDDYSMGGSLEVGTYIIKNNILKANIQYKFDQHKAYDTYGRGSQRIPDTDQKTEQDILSFAIEDTYRFTSQWEAQVGVSYSKRKTKTVGMGSNLNGLITNYPDTSAMLKPDIDTWDPQAILFYMPTEQHTFHYSIAKKTRYPTMREQFSNYAAGNNVACTGSNCPPGGPFPLVSLQNLSLVPERALHQEIGYEGTPLPGLWLQTSVFYSRNKNTIGRSDRDFWTYPGYAVQQTINIAGDVERKGVDFGAEYQVNPSILLGLSYSYIDSKDKDNKNYYFTNIPKHHGAIYGEFSVGEWLSIIPALDFVSSSYYDTAGNSKNPSYTTADIKFSITPPIHKNLSFNFGVENLFDKDYREFAQKYPSPGRYFYANIRYDL